MNVILGLTVFAAVIAIAYPTPLFGEDDDQIRENLFLAKARKQKMVMSSPSSSSLLFNPFYLRGKTDQQKATDMLLKVRKFLEMDRTKEDSVFVSTKLQEKTGILDPVNTRVLKNHYSQRKKYASKKGELATAGEDRISGYLDQAAEADKPALQNIYPISCNR